MTDILISSLIKLFESKGWEFENDLPEFIYSQEIKHHFNHKKFAVELDNNLLSLSSTDSKPIIGIYQVDSQANSRKFILFENAINIFAHDFVNEMSLNTSGQAISARTTIVLESDAIEYVRTICKIYLTGFWIIHWMKDSTDKQWLDGFYLSETSDIDSFAYRLTKEIIKENENLLHCFKWLKILPTSDFGEITDIEKNIRILRSIKIKASLADKICLFDALTRDKNKKINNKKELIDTKQDCLDAFSKINDKKELTDSEQDILVTKAQDIAIKWELILPYINDQRKKKYAVNIAMDILGF
jgi:hypothetical protein